MLNRLSDLLGGIPIPAVIALMVVAAVQLGLQIYSLLDLSRRTTVPGGRKWIWVLVIVVGNLLGVLIYLAVGRTAPVATEGGEGAGGAAARQRAIDQLYGDGPKR